MSDTSRSESPCSRGDSTSPDELVANAGLSYKLQNDLSLEHGSVSDVLATLETTREYNPVLAHYLAYACSLASDMLTSPTYAVPARLGWAETTEYIHSTSGAKCGVLMMRLPERAALIAFRGGQTWQDTLAALDNARTSTSNMIPGRLALAEEWRHTSKTAPDDSPTPLPETDPEHEKPFTQGPPGVLFHGEISDAYQSVLSEVRSFVEDSVGAPVPLLEALRLALGYRVDGDGLDRYESPRARVFVCGHGIGGAVAQLCALDLASLHGRDAVCCYTFGQPRVANAKAAQMCERYAGRLFRITNSSDPVVHAPSKLAGFYHVRDTRVAYGYPPLLGAPGYLENRVPHRGKIVKSLQSIKASARKTFRSAEMDLRVHACYAGIRFPIALNATEPFPMVVRRPADRTSPQPPLERDHPPYRCELDLSAPEPNYHLILRDVEPSLCSSVRRRLCVFAEIRESPYIAPRPARAETEAEAEAEPEAEARTAVKPGAPQPEARAEAGVGGAE